MINKNLIYPTINAQLPRAWGAELLSYEVGPCSYSNGYIKPQGKAFPVKLKAKIGLRPITLVFDFMADSPAESAVAISQMTNELMSGPEIMLPDGFLYWCEYDSASAPSRKAPWIEQVKFKLHGVRHSPLVTKTFTESGRLKADGNMESPMIVELTPSGSDGMTFNGIAIDSNVPVTIDGVYTTVKNSLGDNVFGSTDMTKWPTLDPGDNVITMSGISSAKISYYPIWK